jgi:16S rRNA (cytidine1402-2'-O)-methyltransferase
METKPKPALLLLPNLLGEHRHHEVFLPQSVDRAVQTLDGLIAESEKEGRRFLSRFQTKKPVAAIPIALFNEHTPDDHIDFLLEPIREGERWGLVSDGGLPCIADPGAKLVRRARQTGISIQGYVGPTSLMIGLMLSGLPGQKFHFHGYLSGDEKGRGRDIVQLEQASKKEGSTQIFIEAPYRNQHLLETLFQTLSDETWLCVAWDLTMPTQGIVSQPMAIWRKTPVPGLEKKAAIFFVNAKV